MSSSVFTECPSDRRAADADSNLVVVYGKNGISFDEGGIENIMEEKSISTISVVRLTSPTPSMVEEEEAERLEEMERFLEAGTDRDDSDKESDDAGSRSGIDEIKSEKDHVIGDDNDDSGGDSNDDSTEPETEAPKVRKRPGRKPKVVKKQKKRRKPKERPQIIGLSVEQFYADSTADMVVKNALKLAGVSIFKRTPESDALLEIIRNDHNYTPFTSEEQMKAQKSAEKVAAERQLMQSRKFMSMPHANAKSLAAIKRQAMPLSQVISLAHLQRQLKEQQKPAVLPVLKLSKRPGRNVVKTLAPVEDGFEDDEDANSSTNADDENADRDKAYDTEEFAQLSEDLSEESRETDNDRDSDIDFKMNNSRNKTKRKRTRKMGRRSNTQTARGSAQAPHKPHLKRRKRSQEHNDSSFGLNHMASSSSTMAAAKAAMQAVPLGRTPTTHFLQVRPANKTLPTAVPRGTKVLPTKFPRITPPAGLRAASPKIRLTPVVQVGQIVSTIATSSAPSQEIVINKNLTSPKGVFTNLNTLLGETKAKPIKFAADPHKQRIMMSNISPAPTTPRSSIQAPHTSSKGFMPLGIETAASHKLPAQIVIETHQSSSELAAENDKQLDLINSIVQDELRKSSLLEQPPASADETIPKLVKMLESTAAGLDQSQANASPVHVQASFESALPAAADSQHVDVVDDIDLSSTRLLHTPDEDQITADFLQHVVGLIEEDKQFEAEVVKQVLEIAEPGIGNVPASIDAIASVVAQPTMMQPIFSVIPPLPPAATTQPTLSIPVPVLPAESLGTLPLAPSSAPMACSTPSRIPASTVQPRPEVKVVRGNGRIIYLPPIEAPTTRAKRRAQNKSSPDQSSSCSLYDSTLDNSLLNNSSFDSDGLLVSPQMAAKKPAELTAKKNISRVDIKRLATPRGAQKSNTRQHNADDDSESEDDDDDPNKLWCICRQPHNNRFMICCDQCEDWYHGTCVSVTKSMGLEMEQKGIDWKCPKCVKKQEEKSQPRITDMLLNKRVVADAPTTKLADFRAVEPAAAAVVNELKFSAQPAAFMPKRMMQLPEAQSPQAGALPSGSAGPKPQKRLTIAKTTELRLQTKSLHQQQLNFPKLGSSIIDANCCIVCKRSSRSNGVYCSDECIRKYAQAAINTQSSSKSPEPAVQVVATASKKKDLFEDVLRQADSLSKVERISVFERKSGRVISGHNAPTVHQLKKWLQENPTFEVMQPTTVSAMETEKRQLKRLDTSLGQTVTPAKNAAIPQVLTLDSAVGSRAAAGIRVAAREKPVIKVKEKTANQRRNEEKPKETEPQSSSKPEPIRFNVRRTLKEQLLLRIKEAQVLEAQNATATTKMVQWLTAAEVEHFVKSVESEMYYSFGRDVGAKYKSKYRSLMFNIKDRKNKTLFEKICAKQVEPRQLVRMTPAELASQELAKWREEENRHQLDIIKKSELDLLLCSQNYVVKTHKGEEVIETKADVSLPDASQDVLDKLDHSIVQPSDVSSITDASSREVDSSKTSADSVSATPVAKDKDRETRDRERERDREKERDRRHKSHKHHNHHHGTKRSRSRSSSRSHSLEKRHRSSARREDRHHSDHDHDRERIKEREQQSREKKKPEERPRTPPAKKPEEAAAAQPATSYNLVDQILESEKTVEQAANLVQAAKQSNKSQSTAVSVASSTPMETPPMDNYGRYVQSLSTSAIWSGNVTMIDVSDFHVVMHAVHGNTHQLEALLYPDLDVIGRITRVNVWDYIKKIRKSPTKEIVIVKLLPSNMDETTNYKHFYHYLDSRQRLGVLGTDPTYIRDFYIFPLGSREKVPNVLLTADRVPFYEDATRPDTLLGIIVRCINKRVPVPVPSVPPQVLPLGSKAAKLVHKTRPTTSFTPPSSPKRKRSNQSTSSKDDEFDIDAIIKAPIAAKTRKPLAATAVAAPARIDEPADNPDAPYSPGGSMEKEEKPNSAPSINKQDLERQVDEIDKQIAAQREEILGLLKAEPSTLEKPASSSNVLASIAIPPNLSKILASIKDTTSAVRKASRKTAADDEVYNPEDEIPSSNAYAMARSADKPAKSRLAQLSEAELLSMVPDDLVNIVPLPPPAPPPPTRYEEPPPPGV